MALRDQTDLTARSKVFESRIFTDPVLRRVDAWRAALFADELLHACCLMTARWLVTLKQRREEPLGSDFWELVHEKQYVLAFIQEVP